MHNGILTAARRAAAAEANARNAEIVGLCLKAGYSDLAADFISRGFSVEDAKVALQARAAALWEKAIDQHGKREIR
jgi:hypothetical protein